MDSPKRTFAKAFCWQAMGLLVMALIGFVFTGSFVQGGAMAVLSTAIGTVTYVLHERAWARVSWGRLPAGPMSHDK